MCGVVCFSLEFPVRTLIAKSGHALFNTVLLLLAHFNLNQCELLCNIACQLLLYMPVAVGATATDQALPERCSVMETCRGFLSQAGPATIKGMAGLDLPSSILWQAVRLFTSGPFALNNLFHDRKIAELFSHCKLYRKSFSIQMYSALSNEQLASI